MQFNYSLHFRRIFQIQIICRNIFALNFKRYGFVIMKIAQNRVKTVCPMPQNNQINSDHWEVEKISEANKANEFWKFEALKKFQRLFSVVLNLKKYVRFEKQSGFKTWEVWKMRLLFLDKESFFKKLTLLLINFS